MEKVLPLGSIVKIVNEEDVEYMITTRGILLDENTFYDYGGTIHPVGLTAETYKLFNHSDIQEVQFLGYRNKVEMHFSAQFKKWRNEFVNNMNEPMGRLVRGEE
ncbi:hypothetical protein JOC93_000202 [Priestia taiwanensis]|nr:hypothetical protein [Priestia taiwanensis]